MNIEKLPEFCYAQHPTDRTLVTLVKRGESGYWEYRRGRDEETTTEDVKILNQSLGVSELQAEAMLNGSLFGWDAPGADPDRLAEFLARGEPVPTPQPTQPPQDNVKPETVFDLVMDAADDLTQLESLSNIEMVQVISDAVERRLAMNTEG